MVTRKEGTGRHVVPRRRTTRTLTTLAVLASVLPRARYSACCRKSNPHAPVWRNGARHVSAAGRFAAAAPADKPQPRCYQECRENMGRSVVHDSRRQRSRSGGRLAACLAILAVAADVVLPSTMTAARAGAGVSAGAAELIICTPEGLKRITRADRGSRADPLVARSDALCPICLAAQSSAVESSPAAAVIDCLVILVAFDGGEATLRVPCRSAEPSPARGPPTSA
jgi:hypothetical protein